MQSGEKWSASGASPAAAVDLSGFGLPEDGERAIRDLMNFYDNHVRHSGSGGGASGREISLNAAASHRDHVGNGAGEPPAKASGRRSRR